MTSLAAAGLDSRLGYLGLGLTLVAAIFSRPLAFVLAALHLVAVIAYGDADISALPSVAAGLLSGMLVTPWAVSAALTWVIVAVASVITLFELKVSLWFALIPLALISTALSVGGIVVARWQQNCPKYEEVVNYDDSGGEDVEKNSRLNATESEWGNMFV